jgi:branched-chain amino acid transport system substrate-binding protein
VKRLVCALALAASASLSPAHAADPPLKVGLINTYSGPTAWAAKLFDAGIAAYIEEHGDTVAGRKIELIRRDEVGPQPDLVKRLVQELIVRDKVELIMGIGYTPNAMAIVPLSTEAKKPVIILNAAATPILANAPYMVRVSFTMAQIISPMAHYMAANGVKRAYLLVAGYGPGLEGAAVFEKVFTGAGGTLVAKDRVPLANQDFSAYVQRIKDAKPDAVFLWLPSGPQPLAFLKAYREAGLAAAGIKLFSTGELTDDGFIESLGDLAEGLITSHHYSYVHDSPLNQRVVAAAEKSLGGSLRPNLFTATAYDGMHALYTVVKAQSGTIDPDKTVALLKALNFESPRGPVALDPKTGDIIQNIYIRRTERRNGKLVNVEFKTYPMVRWDGTLTGASQ